MPRYVALLRGINVGGHTVKMDRLRALFEDFGCENVETFIASGNVLFNSTARAAGALERKLEAMLRESLGFDVATFVRTGGELKKVLQHASLRDLRAQAAYIGFLREPPAPAARARLLAHRTRQDDFHVSEREVYWLCRTRMSESPFFKVGIEKALGMRATVRNATTVANLVEKYEW